MVSWLILGLLRQSEQDLYKSSASDRSLDALESTLENLPCAIKGGAEGWGVRAYLLPVFEVL